MADTISLGDVSSKDTGTGSKLKTGGRRKHNMDNKCKTGEVYNTKLKKCVPKFGLEKMKNKMMKRPIHKDVNIDVKSLRKKADMRRAKEDTTKSYY